MDADHEQQPRPVSASDQGGADAAWQQEILRFDELRVVATAQGLVADAARSRLAEALAAARRAVTSADQRLNRARADRDDTAVAAATAELGQARRRADILAQRLAGHAQQAADDFVKHADEVLEQAIRVFDTGLAATSDLLGFMPPNRGDASTED
jgi:hypothetical protein